MRENYKTENTVDKMGREMKIWYIVTPGGSFPFGSEIVKALRDIANYFGSSLQHEDDLETIKKGAMLPLQNIKSPGETRVSSHITLLQTAMMNHFALTLYAMQTKDNTFMKLWDNCKQELKWKVWYFVSNCMFSMILLTTQFFTPQSLGCARDGGHCQYSV